MSNPYNKQTQETLFNNWEHGFSANDENDCPYDEGGDFDPQWATAWKAGCRANMGRKKKEPKPVLAASPPVQVDTLLETMTTDQLVAELVKRKKSDYDEMVAMRDHLNVEIAKMEALFAL